jgi:hypothetical protein
MAYFAELNQNNEVLRVLVFSDDIQTSPKSIEGENYCKNLLGGFAWKESFTDGTRKNAASKGFIYDANLDIFYNPESPYPNWTLDANKDWNAPISKPSTLNANNYIIDNYFWSTKQNTWIGTVNSDPNNMFKWEVTNNNWESFNGEYQ